MKACKLLEKRLARVSHTSIKARHWWKNISEALNKEDGGVHPDLALFKEGLDLLKNVNTSVSRLLELEKFMDAHNIAPFEEIDTSKMGE